jgi:GH25 family lysozyme M1 (1,4-beta-N-acetylmuramidase)
MIVRGRRTLAALSAAAAFFALAPAPAGGGGEMLGIDVSRFQGDIAWHLVADAGVQFAFVQASRGSGDDCSIRPKRCGPDRYYPSNYVNAGQVGIPVGAYHRAFVGGRTRMEVKEDAREEADVFVAQVGELRTGDLLPALDIEAPFAGLRAGKLRVWVRTWLGRVRSALGERPIIYTSPTSWAATGHTTEFAQAGHALWIAHWGVSQPTIPASNWAGRGWAVWQYTSSGRVNGIDGRVDRDRLGVGMAEISVP